MMCQTLKLSTYGNINLVLFNLTHSYWVPDICQSTIPCSGCKDSECTLLFLGEITKQWEKMHKN